MDATFVIYIIKYIFEYRKGGAKHIGDAYGKD